MSSHPPGFSSSPSISPPLARHRQRVGVTLLCLLLVSGFLANMPVLAATAFAAGLGTPPAAHLTLKQFLAQGRPDKVYRGPLMRPTTDPIPPHSSKETRADYSHLPASMEPATMQPLSQAVDRSLLVGVSTGPTSTGTSSTPLDLHSSDGRLDVQVPRGSLDVSQASVPGTKGAVAPSGTLTLHLTQTQGHSVGQLNLLGVYQVEIVDAQNHVVSGVRLAQPFTFVYHYQPSDLSRLGVDPDHLLLIWPGQVATERTHKQATTDSIVPMVNDPKALTLTAQSTVFPTSATSSAVILGASDPQNQTPPVPHEASVGGNAGQMTYSYPLQVAPGPDGFVPQLSLSYSSSDPNGRTSRTSPAGDFGDGWSLSLGSIAEENYPNGSASVGSWYFLSGVGNVSDRLVVDHTTTTTPPVTYYQTEHISRLQIQQVTSSKTNQPCFDVWDTSGTYYEFGCTTDSLQYYTDSGGQHNYRFDLDRIIAPNEGPGSHYKLLLVSYQQDKQTTNNYTSVRDAAIKQITYGYGTSTSTISTLDGTVDITYVTPTYSSGTACAGNIAPRCDDPVTFGSVLAPTVMSTLTPSKVVSYVGSDSANKAYEYDFTFQDSPSTTNCYDSYTLAQISCAGEHLLTQVTPLVYLAGTAHTLKSMFFGYSSPLQNTYYDSQQTVNGNAYSNQTFWQYLTSYVDSSTGVGGTISYAKAYGNTHGTPAVLNGSTVVDDRHDPLYCTTQAGNSNSQLHCDYSGSPYNHPDDHDWSQQIVTQTKIWGTDSSSTQLSPATTMYAYQLAVTGQYTGNSTDCYPYPYPVTSQSDTDCVGDNWIPATSSGTQDSDWQDFYHGEFHGFNQVLISSPSNDLTVQDYYSTEGWATPHSNQSNYNSGHLYEQDVYQGNAQNTANLLSTTVNTYTGYKTANSCNGNLNTVYAPCEVMILSTKTTQVEGTNSSTAPWVQQDMTYDDYTTTNGLGAGYHNLTQQVTSSSDAPSVTNTWSYKTNDQTTTSPAWTYYTVNTPIHHEIDDSSGHIWQCSDTTYDEGAASGIPTPSAGWPTTVQTYSNANCAGKTSPLTTSYTGYDGYGNVVATVDANAQATPTLYMSAGCTLATAPTIFTAAWGKTVYTSCTTYGSDEAQPVTLSNAFAQQSSISYDPSQGSLPITEQDVNSQQTTLAYSFDTNSATNDKRTVQVSQPGETKGSYTSQSNTLSSCTAGLPTGNTTPCFEMDSNTSQYSSAIARTYYDSLGRSVETQTPGPDSSHTTVVFTTYNDAQHSVFQSLPFVVASRSTWLDPNGATDDTGATPGGTATYLDALGRTLAVDDPIFNAGSSSGIVCPSLGGTHATTCTTYSVGTLSGVSGDTNIYLLVTGIDANNHVSATASDTLGRTIYEQQDSGTNSGTLTANRLTTMQYNVLNEPTSVQVKDLAPQSGQSVTTVTTTAGYDDLGRMTSLSDPDRGNYTYTLDANGNVIKEVSGTRTIGSSYDLLGRVGCIQNILPTPDAHGACSSGASISVVNTYDADPSGVTWGSTNYAVGRLTQTKANTSFPSPDNSVGAVTQNFQYDTRGRLITETQKESISGGNLTLPSLPTNQLSQGYNDANQPTSTTTTVGGSPGYTFSQSYDSTTGVSNGLSNTGIGTPTLVSLAYNAQALPSTLTMQTDQHTTLASTTYSYDGDLRPAGSTATWGSGSGTTGTLFSQAVGYDAAGNVTTQTLTQAAISGQSGSGGTEVQNFCYDEQNRLVWAGNNGTVPGAGSGTCGSTTFQGTLGGNYTTPYSYTHLGQLWQGPTNGTGSGQQYLYCNTNQPHQLTGLYPTGTTCSSTSGKTASYTASYDAWGNMTSRVYNGTTGTIAYDKLDHQVRWTGTNAGGTTTGEQWNWYDGSGQRVLRRSYDGSTTTITVYAFGLEEHDYLVTGSTASPTNNIYYYTAAGRLIGELTGNTSQTTTFLFTDTLGSVVAASNNLSGSGAVLGNQAYGPYGNTRYSKGSVGTQKGFTGQIADPISGLDDYGARYYDPVVGRFVSADSVQGNLSGMDPYAYVGGNPETQTDPTGQEVITEGQQGAPADITPSGGDPGGIFSGIGSALAGAIGYVASTLSNPSVWVGAIGLNVGWGAGGWIADQLGLSGSNTGGVVAGGLASGPSMTYGATLNSVTWDAYRQQQPQVTGGGTTSSGSSSGGGTSTTTSWNWPTTSPVTQAAGGGARPPSPGQTATAPGDFCSFTSDTQVSTSQGKQDIGKLHVGDKVWAYNPKTQKMELQPVEHVWIHQDHDLVDLTIKPVASATTNKKGKTGQAAETLHTTSEHPFLTSEKGFVAAGSLKVGMHVRQADGSVGVIIAWHLVSGSKLMYNLEVAQDHTFVVGTGQWVVHNQCDSGPLRKALEIKRGDPFQAQHIMPCQLAKGGSMQNDLVVAAQNEGLDINSAENGIALPNSDAGSLRYNLPKHIGSHPDYTNQVNGLLDQLQNSLDAQYGESNIPLGASVQAVRGLIAQLRAATVAAGGGCTINQVDLSSVDIP